MLLKLNQLTLCFKSIYVYIYFFYYRLTGICQKQHENLIVAVQKAKDNGLIKFDLPVKTYNYEEYKNSK